MLEKERYIRDSISVSLQKWVGISCILGSTLWIFFGIVDYYREGFLKESYIYRIIIVAELLIIAFINTLKRNTTFQSSLTAIGILSSAIINQIIGLKLAGAGSPYYVGLILIIIVAIGLLPLDIFFAFALAVSIWLVYFLPIIFFFKIPSMADFITSNFYLLCAISITSTWRYFGNKSMINELSLQFQLENEKDHLDHVVREKTADLNRSEQWHRSIFENTTDGMLILSKEGVIANANEMACRIYNVNCDRMAGMNVRELFREDQRQHLSSLFDKMLRVKSILFEVSYNSENGKAVSLEISLQDIPIGDEHYTLMVSRDISDRKMYQDQLAQSQKMESIAAFAGGIAHDVRNIITSMIAYIEIVRNDKGVSERTLQRTNLLDKSIRNAGNMISQLLSFARKSKSALAEASLNDVIRDTLNIIKASIGENIEIVHELPQNDLMIQANINQVESVIMNLVFNARDAMPRGGSIVITTQVRVVGSQEDMALRNIPPGTYAVLTISDSGVGIPLEVQGRIFEPFFTTKTNGKGTGLGLAMVYSIVADHKGHITVDSTPGKGSTFSIYFPLLQEKPQGDARTESQEPTTTELKHHQAAAAAGMILLVDDDEALMTMMSDALEARGYKVISTTSPGEGLEILEKDTGSISLLITDMAMPRMDGAELVRRATCIRPGIKVIVISAFNQEKIDQMLQGMTVSDKMHKPFSPFEFVATVNAVLDPGLEAGEAPSTAAI